MIGIKELTLLCVTVFAVGPVAPVVAIGPKRSIADVLPSDTIAWARVGNYSEALAAAEQLPIWQLYQSDALGPFRNQMRDRGENWLVDNYGLASSALQQYASGEFVLVALPTDEGQMTFSSFIETDDEGAARQLIAMTEAILLSRGAERLSSPGELDRVQLQLKDPNEQLVLARLDEHVLIAGDVAAANRMIERWSWDEGASEKNRCLSTSEPFIAIGKQLADSPKPVLQWYVDPIAMSVRSGQFSVRPPSPDEPETLTREPFPRRHGLPGLQAMGGRLWLDEQSLLLRSRTVLHSPPPRKNALAMLDFEPGPAMLPDWIDQSCSSAMLLRWNLEQMILNAESVYDDVTDAPGAFRGTVNDLKNELDVDLERQLFPMLGPEVVIVGSDDVQQNLSSTIVSVEIKDPSVNEAKVATMIYNLLNGDTEARRIRLPGKRYEMWQITIVIGEQSTPFSQAGLIVADGRLWISTHATTLQKMILQTNPSSLTKTKVYQRWSECLKDYQSSDCIGVSLSRMDRDARQTYELLRQNGPAGLEDVESVYAAILRPLLDDVDTTVDYSTLPPFDSIRDYLLTLGFLSENTPTGWEVHGVVFVPEAK